MSYTSAEPVDARLARDHLRAALEAASGPLSDALASLDPGQRERLGGLLRACQTYAEAPPMPDAKTCRAVGKGFGRCGQPDALAFCLEGFLNRGPCSDAP